MAKRMKLISADEYDSLTKRSTPVQETKKTFFMDENKKAESILNNENIPDDIKIQLYGAVMEKVKSTLSDLLTTPVLVKIHPSEKKENLQQVLDKPIVSKDSEAKLYLNQDDINLLATQPESTRENKLKPLMTILKSRPDLISWDHEGRVSFNGSEKIQESNIIDLLAFVSRDLKWKQNPIGINRFFQTCKLLNVPQNLFNKSFRSKFSSGKPHKFKSRTNSGNLFQFWESVLDGDKTNKTGEEDKSSTSDEGKYYSP